MRADLRYPPVHPALQCLSLMPLMITARYDRLIGDREREIAGVVLTA